MRKAAILVLFLLFCLLSFNTSFAKIEREEGDRNDITDFAAARIGNDDIEVTVPSIVYAFLDTDIKIKFVNPQHPSLLINKNNIDFIINGTDTQLDFIDGEASFKKKFNTETSLSIFIQDFSYNHKIIVIRLWEVLFPVVLIIFLIVFKTMKKHKLLKSA